jgi:hypothetical protein
MLLPTVSTIFDPSYPTVSATIGARYGKSPEKKFIFN